MQVIAIDLGSNTLRVLKYDCTLQKRVAEFEKTVRTAEFLKSGKTIDETTYKRVIDALNEAKKEIGFSGCKVSAVTTQALRVAKNAQEIIGKIKKSTGVTFRVIDTKQEALLTLDAVLHRLSLLNIAENFVLVDIGGGSTEITFYINSQVFTKSFALGIVTVANSAKSMDAIYAIVDEYSKEIEAFCNKFNKEQLTFVATAGTPTTLAAMKLGLTYKTYDSRLINGTILYYDELDNFLSKLLSMNQKQREEAVGVGRDDLIIAGIVIFQKLYKILNKKCAVVIDDGLREGVALLACKNYNKDE